MTKILIWITTPKTRTKKSLGINFSSHFLGTFASGTHFTISLAMYFIMNQEHRKRSYTHSDRGK